jgi:hypothetical protein
MYRYIEVFTESEGEVGLDIEFKWGAKEPGVVLDVSVMGVHLPVALEHIEAYGTFRIIFGPLVPWWPSFSALTLAFVVGLALSPRYFAVKSN